MKDKLLLKVRTSRKAYSWGYTLIFAIFGSLIYLYAIGIKFDLNVYIFSSIFSLGLLKVIEIHRIRTWWGVTRNSLIQSTGILNKNIREVSFSSISDLDLDKPLIKRFMNYGDVNVRLFLNETSIHVRGINSPEKFIAFLQETMPEDGGIKNVLANRRIRK